MKCKSCKRDIPDESIFCMFCGEKVIRNRRKKKEVSVPKPRKLGSDTWFGQPMVDGVRVSVSAPTEEEYYAKARAIKLGLLEVSKVNRATLKCVIRNYIDDNANILSPSTIRGYEIIYRNRFKNYMDCDVNSINYQAMVNEEAVLVSAKTVLNAWALVSAALGASGYKVPKIKKPSVVRKEEDWLDYQQIKVFLNAIRDSDIEVACLLALHGLRTSEFLDLDVSQVSENGILVRGATVPNKDNEYVHKETNKNRSSRRTVPILIPRLLELLPKEGKVVDMHPSTLRWRLEKVCTNAGLPTCSPHDLRRSFASLAYHLGWNAQTTMLIGGWSNLQTVNEVYRKLAEQDKLDDVEKMKLFYGS